MSLDFDALKEVMAQASPHMRGLGLEFVHIEEGLAVGRVPYREDLVGDPSTGVLHGGVVTSLLDSTAGVAVLSAIGGAEVIATLGLRIDYLRGSPPGQALHARVECYKLTTHVAFVRGVAYNDRTDDPMASLAATFMRRTATAPTEASSGVSE